MGMRAQFVIPVLVSILVLSISFPVNNVFALTEDAKLTPSDAKPFVQFGSSVSISGDTAIVGARSDDDACPSLIGCNSGSASVFDFDGTSWSQTAKLTASDAAQSDQFGVSVSIDGDTAIVGAELDDDAGSASGSAYIFEKIAGVWTQTAKLTASDAAQQDQFGVSVSISGDTAIVGAERDDDACPSPTFCNSGSAYIFEKDSVTGIWSEVAKLTASDAAASDRFGLSVSISGDTAIVGSVRDLIAFPNTGSAYIFVKPVGGWVDSTETAKLTASDAAFGDGFSFSVSIDVDKAIVGAIGDRDAGSLSGSAYIFEKIAGVWTQTAKLAASDAEADKEFGFSVSIDGDKAIVGAFNFQIFKSSNSAYAFEKDSVTGIWSEVAKLTASDVIEGHRFGQSVSISGDAAIVGAERNNGMGDSSGAAYVFDLTNSPPVAEDDPAETLANISVDVQVLNNDTDPNGDSLSIDSTSNGPSNGVATIIGNIISYSPNTDFNGVDTFDYTISDGNGGFDTATVTITVLSAAEGSQNLIDLINDIGTPTGTETSLAAPLGNASDLLNDVNTNNDAAACGKLDAFINHVNAEEGSTLTTAEADLLRGLAENVKTSIGC